MNPENVEEADDSPDEPCEICNGPVYHLGYTTRYIYLRCEDCGSTQVRERKP